MTIIYLKFFHFLAILFAGGVIVGSGLIQKVYAKANQIPDLHIAKILKLLGYIGLISLLVLWTTGIFLSNIIYNGFSINSAFTLKIIAAGLLLGLSIFINLYVYTSSKKQLPTNKKIMKAATMISRVLIIIILIGAVLAFN
jgi:formate/nitrite transporter FocA (FNT family)|tara:strand:- start:173 stop:595 length:423 start_codon:yes stop_codon:yes gene_type:complete